MANYIQALGHVASVGLAVSDPGRLRVLTALAGRSLCVCQLTALLGLAPSTVSKHLSVLKQAGLVIEKKAGRWVFHTLCDCDCSCRPVIDWIQEQLKHDRQVAADRLRLKEILKLDPEELCRR
jgi:ArsR family transcriptional regulator, arsenate/arsenite/antimonite-responsive transcriptional repressor